MNDIKHPKHYNMGQIEVFDVIEDWKLGFNLGNVIKYIGRCEYKGNKENDLRKAIEYIEREIHLLLKKEGVLCKHYNNCSSNCLSCSYGYDDDGAIYCTVEGTKGYTQKLNNIVDSYIGYSQKVKNDIRS